MAARLPGSLLCIPDADFQHLVTTATPVSARIQLTRGKTTSTWTDEDGNQETGNLWYEETLPPDCLFSVLVSARPGKERSLEDLRKELKPDRVLQIGANETVGQGVARWGGARD